MRLLRNASGALLLLSLSLFSSAAQRRAATDVWIGANCTVMTRAIDRMDIVVDESLRQIKPTVCIDRGASAVEFQTNSLRIVPYKTGDAAIQLTCVNTAKAEAFYTANSGKVVTFVTGKRALFNYAVSEHRNMKCGWQSAGDLRQAIATCRLIARAWKVSPISCTSLCPPDQSAGTSGICVAHQ